MSNTALDVAYDLGAQKAQEEFRKEAGRLDGARKFLQETWKAQKAGPGVGQELKNMLTNARSAGKDHAPLLMLPTASAGGYLAGGGMDVAEDSMITDGLGGGLGTGAATALGTGALLRGLSMKRGPAMLAAGLLGSGAAFASGAGHGRQRLEDQAGSGTTKGILDFFRGNVDDLKRAHGRQRNKQRDMYADYNSATSKFKGDVGQKIRNLLGGTVLEQAGDKKDEE